MSWANKRVARRRAPTRLEQEREELDRLHRDPVAALVVEDQADQAAVLVPLVLTWPHNMEEVAVVVVVVLLEVVAEAAVEVSIDRAHARTLTLTRSSSNHQYLAAARSLSNHSLDHSAWGVGGCYRTRRRWWCASASSAHAPGHADTCAGPAQHDGEPAPRRRSSRHGRASCGSRSRPDPIAAAACRRAVADTGL